MNEYVLTVKNEPVDAPIKAKELRLGVLVRCPMGTLYLVAQDCYSGNKRFVGLNDDTHGILASGVKLNCHVVGTLKVD